ncbi:hypothetical protein LZG74_11255 [Dyadobacter sp. CY327]|uniref:hypothetical protein n=1 Tax=Dyadobacter sp. CY327 TaxID=2907301 RepID=UPI001F1FA547|nr:hypothetical protein [Dyadobacter sp. CY327]MCE7070884.1 hypothetical protein [Dyadobacter sp. CY327]
MCTCKQKSKKPAGTPGNFNYVFSCTNDDGTKTEIKVTAGNDNEAKQLAELECDESKSFGLLKTIRDLDLKGVVYTGFMFPDNNVPGHVLLVAAKDKVYSFNKNDILSEVKLPTGMFSLEIRNGSAGYLSSPFIVGSSTVNFQNITDHLVTATPKPQKGDPRLATNKDISALKKLKPLARTIASAAANWTMPNGVCTLGSTPPNNCAHYLSDAFIKAGYSELIRKNSEGGGIFTQWCDTITPPYQYKENARPIRALDMKNWFNSISTKRETTKQSGRGFWAVYQKRQSDGQEHVLIYDSDNDVVYGTGGIGYWTWSQFFYQW